VLGFCRSIWVNRIVVYGRSMVIEPFNVDRVVWDAAYVVVFIVFFRVYCMDTVGKRFFMHIHL
jgi:hypothetical protein